MAQHRKWDLMDAIQGAYVGATLYGLFQSGFLNELAHRIVYYSPVDLDSHNQKSSNENDNNNIPLSIPDSETIINLRTLATQYKYNLKLLVQLLEFMYLTTDIISKRQEDNLIYYSLNDKYAEYMNFGHDIDKLMGCYMPCLWNLDQTLQSPSLGSNMINEGKLTTAFDGLQPPDSLVMILSKFLSPTEMESLVVGDLGCGPGSLLCSVAKHVPQATGWGLDISETMCQAARQKLIKFNGAERFQIYTGDARNVGQIVPENLIKNTTVLYGGSILNEFFQNGNQQVVEFLKMIKTVFPRDDLRFFVMDYLGKLTHVNHMNKSNQHTIIHDVAQAVSGQGIPCATTEEWNEIYKASGWVMAERLEYHRMGMDAFIHVLVKE